MENLISAAVLIRVNTVCASPCFPRSSSSRLFPLVFIPLLIQRFHYFLRKGWQMSVFFPLSCDPTKFKIIPTSHVMCFSLKDLAATVWVPTQSPCCSVNTLFKVGLVHSKPEQARRCAIRLKWSLPITERATFILSLDLFRWDINWYTNSK